MAAIRLIPGIGLVKDSESGNVVLYPGGLVKEADAGGGATTSKSVVGSVAPSAALQLQTAKIADGQTVMSNTMALFVSFARAGQITAHGGASTGANLTQDAAGSVLVSGSVSRSAAKVARGVLTPSATLTRTIGKSLTSSLTLSGVTQKTAEKILDGSLTASGTIAAGAVLLVASAGSMLMSALLNTLFVPAGTIVNTVKQFVRGVRPSMRAVFRTNKEERRE